MTCKHTAFRSQVNVLCLPKGGEMRWLLDVRVSCAQCGRPFRFADPAIPVALVKPMDRATINRLGDELRVPIEPRNTVGSADAPRAPLVA